MIIIVDSKEHAGKYVEAGLVDKFEEVEHCLICATSEQLEASWGKGRDDDRQGDDEAEGDKHTDR